MTWYCLPWWMTSLPSRYSKIAESPEASEIERCTVPGSPVGATIGTMRNSSLRRPSTASAVVA